MHTLKHTVVIFLWWASNRKCMKAKRHKESMLKILRGSHVASCKVTDTIPADAISDTIAFLSHRLRM